MVDVNTAVNVGNYLVEMTWFDMAVCLFPVPGYEMRDPGMTFEMGGFAAYAPCPMNSGMKFAAAECAGAIRGRTKLIPL